MALYVKRDEKQNQLQEKIAADLKRKMAEKEPKMPEVDPAFLEQSHETRPAGMIIAVLLFLMSIVIVVIMIRIV